MELCEFRLRTGSGGAGKYRGGEGVRRRIKFLRPLSVGILSERRTLQPYGMCGGGPGAVGRNSIIRSDGSVISLGAKNTYPVLSQPHRTVPHGFRTVPVCALPPDAPTLNPHCRHAREIPS